MRSIKEIVSEIIGEDQVTKNDIVSMLYAEGVYNIKVVEGNDVVLIYTDNTEKAEQIRCNLDIITRYEFKNINELISEDDIKRRLNKCSICVYNPRCQGGTSYICMHSKVNEDMRYRDTIYCEYVDNAD
ncbi:MAG: hypothetical protein WC783_00050 [Candidatus Paceibacterota bacterium]|jgi:hypothetical protein